MKKSKKTKTWKEKDGIIYINPEKNENKKTEEKNKKQSEIDTASEDEPDPNLDIWCGDPNK